MQLLFRGNPVFKCLLAAALCVVLLGAFKTNAESPRVSPMLTQVELIQWLVQLSGDTVPGGTPQDFVNWATGQGLTPVGGWNANAVLTRDVLAQVLVQFFNLSAKPGTDPMRILQREGVDIPGATRGNSQITRSLWATLVSDGAFSPRASSIYGKKHTEHKTPPHKQSPPKKADPPRHDNGNNKHEVKEKFL